MVEPEPGEKRAEGRCVWCAQLFARKNNHQRRFCTQEHAQLWHNGARDYGFETYESPAMQEHRRAEATAA